MEFSGIMTRRWRLRFVALLAIHWLAVSVSAQEGSISGVARDANSGSGIPQVTVTVRGTLLASRTDNSGNFLINGVPAGNHILIFTKDGYQRGTVSNVKVVAGQNSPAGIEMNPEYYTMETYEVIADPFGEQSAQLMFERQLDIGLVDAIGSDFFSRAGAGDAAEILTKVTGASVVGGKYVIIRGLGDRYGGTTLNGLTVPSSDPDKKTVQMDIFPSSVIESIVTSKTFTPDKIGSFTGGLVDVRTKSFPEEPFIKISIGTGYNTQASSRDDFLTYGGGGTGVFGQGFGVRSVPAEWQGPGPDIQSLESAIRRGNSAEQEAAINEIRRLSTLFSPSMGASLGASGIAHKYSITGGGNTEFLGRRLGVLGGFNYDKGFSFAENAEQNRYNASAATQTFVPRELFSQIEGSENLNYSAVANLGYQLSENQTLAFTALYVRNIRDEAVSRVGTNFQEDSQIAERHVLSFTDRVLKTVQASSDLTIPGLNNFNSILSASYSETGQDQPDLRFLEYSRDPESGNVSITPSFQTLPTRVFRAIEENNVNVKLDNKIPFTGWRDLESELKFGFSYSDSNRSFQEENFVYDSGNNYDVLDDIDPSNLGAGENIFLARDRFGGVRPTLSLRKEAQSVYDGVQSVWGGYIMGDLRVWDKLRLIPGARYETTLLGIEATNRSLTSRTELNEANLLPAVSLSYEIAENMNLRFGWGNTIARPTFKEIAAVTIEDYVNNVLFTGNPDLVLTEASNLDLRWEWFPSPGYILSASVFHKKLTNPIELEQVNANDEVQAKNRDEATVVGFELEARHGLGALWEPLNAFEIGANYTYVESEINTSPFEFESFAQGKTSRPLAGQSPFILNLDLTYRNEDLGSTMSLFYNVFGERLALTSRITPSVFEQPVPTLDFTWRQRLRENMTLRFSAKNLLNPDEEFTIELPRETAFYQRRSSGRAFSVQLTYDF